MIPSNSLAAVYGIATDCAEREVLGPGVAIDIDAIDETTTRVDTEKLLARLAIRHGRNPAAYMDQALMPVGDDNDETGDLLTRTTDARAAVAHARRVAVLTGSNS